MANQAKEKTNSSAAAEAAEKALQEAEASMPDVPKKGKSTDRKRRLTPASHVQVAKRAMDAIIDFDYDKFHAEAGYEAEKPNDEQMGRIIEFRNKLDALRGEFNNVRSSNGNGKTIEQRLTSTIKIVKAMNPKLKGEDLKEAVKVACASAYNSSALIGYDEKIDELIGEAK